MMNTYLPKQLCLFVLLFTPLAATSANDITVGMMLSNTCAACHGTDGKSPGAIPSINGKSAGFISQALKDFRSGNRSSTVMGRHAKAYSDEEIQLIADYFANLK